MAPLHEAHGAVAAPLAVPANTSGLVPIVIRPPEFEVSVGILPRTSLAEVGLDRLFEPALDKSLVEIHLAWRAEPADPARRR